jgi:hypothetical protein
MRARKVPGQTGVPIPQKLANILISRRLRNNNPRFGHVFAHLTNRHGKRGTEKRKEFEIMAKVFLTGEVIKDQRQMTKLT